MSVRFVIGRAGTGKTHHCLSAVREKLLAGSFDGPRLILLVPEQASLQTERALLATPELKVIHRAEVLSFRRIALRIAGHPGAEARTALSVNGRSMILRYLLSKLGPKLEYFKNAERFPGFLERLGRTIDELINEAVTGDELDRALESPDDDPLRRHKLEDLRRIFAAYFDYLGTRRLDPSQYLEVARARIGDCAWLHGAEIWVDGFAGFTRQERLTLVALARVVARLEVTLLMDPRCATPENMASPEASDLWSKPARTYAGLRRDFRESGVEIESPLILEPPTPPRFRAAPALAAVERTIFRNESPPPSAGPAVRVFEAANRRVEVAHTVAHIAELVRTSNDRMRYRDIGITVRDLQPYHDLLAASLEAAGIPYFVDRRRPTSHHPLVEWLRSFVQLPLESFSLDTIRLLLKTELLPIDRDDGDLIENHLITTELSGLEAWSKPWRAGHGHWDEGDTPSRKQAAAERLDRLNRARQALLGQLKPWWDFATANEMRTSREWAEALAEQMQQLGVIARLEEWADAAEEDGDLDRAEEHRQILRDVDELFEELASVLPDEPLSLRQLAQMLDSALAQFTLGMTPPTLDQVLVTGIERSRNPDLKVLFVLGFNDGTFPAAPVEDAILNDDDRAWLTDRGMELTPPVRELLLEERFLAYVAFTRPSERLIVSYAATEKGGTELRPSPYLQDLCPGADRVRVDDPFRERGTWAVHGVTDLSAQLAYEFGSRPPRDRDDSEPRRLWNTLYNRVRADAAAAGPLGRALAALAYENRAALSAESIAKLYPEALHTSVSRLETHATCPFKYFAEWNLKIEPRQSARLQPVDIGKLHHAVLEDFIKRLLDQGRSFVDLREGELIDGLEASLRTVTENLPEVAAASAGRDQYVIDRSRGQLERVLRTQQAICDMGSFRPAGAELCFGFSGEGGLEPLSIDTPAGRRVLLRGIIDRVDLADAIGSALGVVIDYKRTPAKRLDLCGSYHGLALQLLAYLLVLEQHGNMLAERPIVPAGALYVSLVESYANVDHPSDAESSTSSLSTGMFRPRGLLDLSHVGELDHAFSETGRSEVYQVALKKDGGLSRVDFSDAAESEDFARLLVHTTRRIGEHADGILNGEVAVQPYRLGTFSPCSWCDLQPVCRFEFPTTSIRSLDRLKRSEVFERLK